jgi:Flp pilus assembly protein TadG
VTRDARGQAIVEFALVMPILAVLLFGLLDVGRVVWGIDSISSAARVGARFAVVHGGSPATSCPVGPPAATANVPAASASCPYPSPSKQAIRDAASAGAVAAGGSVTIDVCYGDGCTGNTDVTNATNGRGTLVTVRVHSTVSLVLAALLHLGDYTLTGTSTMVVNN